MDEEIFFIDKIRYQPPLGWCLHLIMAVPRRTGGRDGLHQLLKILFFVTMICFVNIFKKTSLRNPVDFRTYRPTSLDCIYVQVYNSMVNKITKWSTKTSDDKRVHLVINKCIPMINKTIEYSFVYHLIIISSLVLYEYSLYSVDWSTRTFFNYGELCVSAYCAITAVVIN